MREDIVRVSVAAGAAGGTNASKQSPRATWPGGQTAVDRPALRQHGAHASCRRPHRPIATRAAVVSTRKAAARAFNLPNNPRESEFHVSVAELLDWILLPPAMFTTFPAGWGKLSTATAGRLHASGMKKGMPDILVFAPHTIYSTRVIGIELKVGANAVSSAQRTMFAQLQAVGVHVYVCRSIENVVAALDDNGIRHREVSTHAERRTA